MLSGPEKSAHIALTGTLLHAHTIVETGTADHQNIVALAEHFDQLYTIELDHGFYLQALWGTMDLPEITCIYGDSGDILQHLSYRLHGTVLWWLDAHYCGGARGREDTPVRTELEHIFRYRRTEPNVVLIDDARMFGSDPAYPTVEWVQQFVDAHDTDGMYVPVFVEDDIIHIIPRLGL